MELHSYDGDKDPGYPTLDEFRSNRRKYLSRMVKTLGSLALSGLGILSFGKDRRKAPRLLGDPMTVSPPTGPDSSKAAPACSNVSKKKVSHRDGRAPMVSDTAHETIRKMGEIKAPEPPPKKIGKVKAPNPHHSLPDSVPEEELPPPTGGIPRPPKQVSCEDTVRGRLRGKPKPPEQEPPRQLPGAPPPPMPPDSTRK